MKRLSHRRGFSLVELSIVLVIIGLLAGGILAGQSLIRSAEIRSISTDYQKYSTAANAFVEKYKGVPGDFSAATDLWGRQIAVGSCRSWTSSGVNTVTGVCDGNADRQLTFPGAASTAGEIPQFWRHLAVAGLINGTYSGLAGAAGVQHCVVGTDCPAGKINTSGWGVHTNAPADTANYAITTGNYFLFGLADASNLPLTKALTPEEAQSVDTKLDDGKPAAGLVIARYWNNECATPVDGVTFANTNLDARYNVGTKTLQCALYFINAF